DFAWPCRHAHRLPSFRVAGYGGANDGQGDGPVRCGGQMSRTATLPEQAVFPVQVFYEDTDAGGVVYHANYLRYFERARSLWMESFGLTHSHLAQTLDIGFAVAHADVRFQAPARLDDHLQVSVAVQRMRAASIVFEQLIRRQQAVL